MANSIQPLPEPVDAPRESFNLITQNTAENEGSEVRYEDVQEQVQQNTHPQDYEQGKHIGGPIYMTPVFKYALQKNKHY